MYTIDLKNRRVIIETKSRGTITINEFDRLNRVFLDGTHDKYECELVLLEVPVMNENNEDTGKKETKAFARRVGNEDWLMIFNETEFNI